MTITTVLPALNEEVSIGSIIVRILQYADHVLVINGGSIDRMAEVAQLAGAEVLHALLLKNTYVAGFQSFYFTVVYNV